MARSKLRWWVALGIVGASAPLWGQATQPAATQPQDRRAALLREGLNPESFYGKEDNQGVYVRDSATALEKLAHATRMERLQDWDKAATLLQEVLDQYRDRMVPAQVDKDNRIFQYTSVVQAVQEKLARWPEEGLNAYRNLYEASAQLMLDQARPGDLGALKQVEGRYFATDAGKVAAIRLMDWSLEAGDFDAAAWQGDKLLAWHPNLSAERPMVLYRTAYAYHLGGNAAAAGKLLEQLKEKYPDQTGKVGGQEVKLAEALTGALAGSVTAERQAGGESYRMLGGSADRAMIPSVASSAGARFYSIPLAKGSSAPRGSALAKQAENEEKSLERAGLTLGIIPAVDRGELYFQDGLRVYAINLESGLPLAGWLATYPGERRGQYVVAAAPQGGAALQPRRAQLTLTLTDSSVLAVMGSAARGRVDVWNGQMMPGEADTRLVCLDRQSGQERWTISPRQLPEEISGLRSLVLISSPLVVGEQVYVLGRGGKGGQFEDCYVLCFDVTSGAYRWSSYIASASSGALQVWGGPPQLEGNAQGHLAYASGRLYVLSNVGALAALDAYNGTIQWLSIYPREAGLDPENLAARGFRGRRFAPNPVRLTAPPWAPSPPVVKDGKVFILPSDGEYLMVYDAGTGLELKRVPLKDLGNSNTLLGVWKQWAITSGDERAYAVNWEKYDAASNAQRTIASSSQFGSDIRGRGFLTEGSLYLANEKYLSRLAINDEMPLRGLEAIGRYPVAPRSWDESEGPGNVVVTGEQVILATASRVDVYTDLSVARAKLDREEAAAPSSADVRLRYAELLFVAGQRPAALEKLDEAVKLLGGLERLAPGAGRNRVFGAALLFAQKLAREEPVDAELIQKLYDRAAAAADTPSQQVHWRLSRAEFADAQNDLATGAKLYQQILADADLRAVPIAPDEYSTPEAAAAVAETQIGRLLDREGGAAAYRPFEQAAEQQLMAARQSKNPTDFLSVAQTYPNSRTAATAMLEAADAFEAARQPRQATQILRQVYAKYPDSDQKRRIVEAMARDYLQLPKGLEVAIGRLSQAARLWGDSKLERPLVLPNGRTIQNVSFEEARRILSDFGGQQAGRQLADFHLPYPKPRNFEAGEAKEPVAFEAPAPALLEHVTALAVPLREWARHDRVVTWSAGGVSVYAVGSSKPLASSSALKDTPLGSAWLGEKLLVWSGQQMALLSGGDGAVQWSMELSKLPTPEVVGIGAGEAEEEGNAGQVMVQGNGAAQVRVMVGGRMMVVNNGNLVMAQMAAPEAPGGAEAIVQVRPLEERIVLATSNGRIVALNSSDGQVAWQSRLGGRGADRVLASDDFTVVRQSDNFTQQLVVFDSFSGRVVFRKAFGAQAGFLPQNVALSADGMLVYTMPDRLCGKDLFEPGNGLKFEEPRQPQAGIMPYMGAIGEDQLLISQGRILAMSDSGQLVRVYSLETGRLLRHKDPRSGQEVDSVLPAGGEVLPGRNPMAAPALRVVGPYLYVVGSRSVVGYNLDRPELNWTGAVDVKATPNIQEVFVGQDHLVLLDQPVAQGNVPGPYFRLHAYSRAQLPGVEGAESGRLDFLENIFDASGIRQWQAVNGGFCYLSGEGKVYYLRGTRK